MQKVLVTGGAGFIGSHLVEALVGRGLDVTVVDDLSTGRIENLSDVSGRFRLEIMDLVRADLGALLESGSFDTIFHAAAGSEIQASIDDSTRDLEANIVGTHNLLAALRKAPLATALVNISSAAVYGEGSGKPITEADPTSPVSPYGVSKLAAELYVSLYARLYGLRTCSLRLFSVFGPRLRKQVIWDFMTRLAADPTKLTVLGDGMDMRDLNYVQNVVHAVLIAADRAPMDGGVFNVASGESVTIDEIARQVSRAMGVAPELDHTRASRPGHARRWEADMGRIAALGYEPAVSFERGMVETVEWFRQNGQAG